MSAADRTSTRMVLTGGGLAAFLAVGHTATDTVAGMLGALLPTLQDRFGLTQMTLALLVATLAFGSSLMQPLLGELADRLGQRLVGGVGLIASAVLLSLLGVAPAAWMLFALLLAGGLGSAAYHPAGASMARAAGGERPGLAVSLFSAGGTLGLALGPAISISFVAALGLSFTPWLMIPGVLVGILMIVAGPRRGGAPVPRRLTGFDMGLLRGPVGQLSLTEICSSLAFVTFTSAMPLWLVTSRGMARDDALIGGTLSVFSLSAALGGIIAAALSAHLSRRLLVSGSMLLAPLPLLLTFHAEPGSVEFFLAVMLGGALINAGFPLKIVTAQDLTPQGLASASGMLMGFATGAAGALLAFHVLGRGRVAGGSEWAAVAGTLAGVPCQCGNAYAAATSMHGPSRTREAQRRVLADHESRACSKLSKAGSCSAKRPSDIVASRV